ncbi:MAG: DJ-1 family glyoxalase III [Atopobium sp.]|uniref:DJ-1 family glyoxalase III n=1 Tax=Atopobium sp. TaxID=1872650 RepID=UPI002A7EAB05|nr:DJ-1 family glyoxalase III [Atopobium sp.]MDY4521997.1 DJ-1 family glyoxalase III [Atopobium sp.]
MEAQTNKRVAVFFAEGMEEIEGLTVVDILYRAGIPCDMVAITPELTVVSSHNVTLVCHRSIYDVDFDFASYDMLVLPGGLPGTTHLAACTPLCDALKEFAALKKNLAAICAAPSILAELGLLQGRIATANPGFQQILAQQGAQVVTAAVAHDGTIITSQGMATALDFALEIVRTYLDEEAVQKVRTSVVDMRAL